MIISATSFLDIAFLIDVSPMLLTQVQKSASWDMALVVTRAGGIM